jgi:hypothetical protein
MNLTTTKQVQELSMNLSYHRAKKSTKLEIMNYLSDY